MKNYLYLFIIVFITIILYITLNHLTKNHKNLKKRKLNKFYYDNISINLLISVFLIFFIFINYNFSNHLIPKLQNIIFYFIISDSLYYWIHRIIHKNPILKNFFHYTHHDATKLIPLDIFYLDYKECILYILIIFTCPLLFIHLNFIEYIIILIISFYHSWYIHSDTKLNFIFPLFINSKYHKLHHTVGGGNYAVFFNIWDKFMGSKIKKRISKKTRLGK